MPRKKSTPERIERIRDGRYLKGTYLELRNPDANRQASQAQARFNALNGISGGDTSASRRELARLRAALTANNYNYRKKTNNPLRGENSSGKNGRFRTVAVRDANGNFLGNNVIVKQQQQYDKTNRTGDGRIGLQNGVGTVSNKTRVYAETKQPKETNGSDTWFKALA